MEIENIKVCADEKRIKDYGFKRVGDSYKYSTSLYKSKGKDTIFAEFLLYLDDKILTVNVIDANTGMGYSPFYIKPNHQNLVLNKMMVNYKKFIDKLAKAGIVRKEENE